MKKITTIPLFLLSLAISLSGQPPEDFDMNLINEQITNTVFTADETEVSVLDSTILTITSIFKKEIYTYDEQAREIQFDSYQLFTGNDELSIDRKETTTYASNEIVNTINRLSSTPPTLELYRIHTTSLDMNQVPIEVQTEEFEDNILTDLTKEILTAQSGDTAEWLLYRWSEDMQDFNLIRKRIFIENDSLEQINILFKQEGNFVNNARITTRYSGPKKVTTLYSIELSDTLSSTGWKYFSITTDTKEENSPQGYRLRKVPINGELTVRDSFPGYYNSFYQPVFFTLYYHDLGTPLDSFRLGGERKYEYDSDFRLVKEEAFKPDFLTGLLELYSTEEYFYSTIDISTKTTTINSEFPINLHFKNPSTRNDLITIVGEERELYKQFDYWIIDQQGRIINRDVVSIGSTIPLIDLKSNGIYYVVLFDDTSHQTWKVNIH